jgi:hypothetical protein
MDWSFYDIVLIGLFVIFIPWIISIVRKQMGQTQNALSIANESIALARRQVELTELQLKQLTLTNELLAKLLKQ